MAEPGQHGGPNHVDQRQFRGATMELRRLLRVVVRVRPTNSLSHQQQQLLQEPPMQVHILLVTENRCWRLRSSWQLVPLAHPL